MRMGRHLDALFEEESRRPPRRHSRRRRPKRKRAKTREEEILASLERKLKGPPPNPLADPAAGMNGPRMIQTPDGPAPAPRGIEFAPDDVTDIRLRFHATQRRFAKMMGISVGTLRNWEQGRRSPQGPARALLRVAKANPNAVAEVLLRWRRAWWME